MKMSSVLWSLVRSTASKTTHGEPGAASQRQDQVLSGTEQPPWELQQVKEGESIMIIPTTSNPATVGVQTFLVAINLQKLPAKPRDLFDDM